MLRRARRRRERQLNRISRGRRGGRAALGLFAALCLALVSPAPPLFGDLPATQPVLPALDDSRVLILTSYGDGRPGVDAVLGGFFATLTGDGISVDRIFTEHLDLERSGGPEQRTRLASLLHSRYDRRHLDLIYIVEQPALDFFLRELSTLAPGAPVILARCKPPPVVDEELHNYVLQLDAYEISRTLSSALALFPRAKRLLFVSGSSPSDRAVAAQAAAAIEALRPGLAHEDTSGLTYDQMRGKILAPPPDTVILVLPFNKDSVGKTTVQMEVAFMAGAEAGAPVFTLWDNPVGRGVIGGAVTEFRQVGAQAGAYAFALISGMIAAPVGRPVLPASTTFKFDWAAIQRWHGQASALPAGSVFLNRPPSLWEQHRGTVIFAVLFILAEAALIAVLLMQTRLMKVAQQALRESEALARQALAEKETLLRELFHRTRNNMQVIIALLTIAGDSNEDPEFQRLIADMNDRIFSMSLVHKKLYESRDLSRIDLKEYAEELVKVLTQAQPEAEGRIKTRVEGEPVTVLIDTAVPFGLVLHELVSNALRHAFPEGRRGEILVRVCRDGGGSIDLTVADDGVGPSCDLGAPGTARLGLKLVHGLVEAQMWGSVRFERGKGLLCRVNLSDEGTKTRV